MYVTMSNVQTTPLQASYTHLKQPRKCKRLRERASMKRKAKKTRKKKQEIFCERTESNQRQSTFIHSCATQLGEEGGSGFATQRIYACGSGQKIKPKKRKKSQLQLNRILLKTRERIVQVFQKKISFSQPFVYAFFFL